MEEKLELAEIAYRGENYSDSYQKYSAVVERDIKNKKAWIGKGLSTGRKSTPKSNTLKEAKISLEKAKELELTEEEKNYIADEIIEIGEDFINKSLQSVVDILTEKDKKPMGTGELYAVRRVGQLADRLEAFNDHWEYFKEAIEFSRFSLEFNESAKSYKGILTNIDLILNESNQDFHQDYKAKLKSWRKETIASIREYNSEFSAKPLEGDSGNCFIATAAYGSYNSSVVIELREFRDTFLQRSLVGRKFVQIYYFCSPPIAEFIKQREDLRSLTRKFLEKTILKMIHLLQNKT